MPYDRLLGRLRTSDSGSGAGTVTSVTAGTGLLGTPNPIVASGTVELNINGLTTETTLAAGDLFPFLDVSVGTGPTAQRKVTLANLATAIGTGGTVTSVTAGNGLTATPNPIVGSGTIEVGTALANLLALGNGIIVKTSTTAWAARSLVAPAAGITITNADGTAGNPTFALANDLAALEALTTAGIAVRTGTSTWTTRSLVQPAAGITISDGDGVAGNPTFALANDLAGLEGLSTTGIAVRTGTSTWTTRTINGGTQNAPLGTVTNGDGVAGNPTINFPDPGLFTQTGWDSIDVTDWDASAAPDYNVLGSVNSTALTTQGLTANNLYASPFVCSRTCTISEIYCRVVGGAGAGREFRIGIYTNKGRTRLYPDALVYSSGILSAATAGSTVGETGLSVTLTAGNLYWYAMVENNTNPTYSKQQAGSMMRVGVDKDNITVPILAVARVFAYGALPDPFGTTGTPVGVVTPPPAFFVKMSA